MRFLADGEPTAGTEKLPFGFFLYLFETTSWERYHLPEAISFIDAHLLFIDRPERFRASAYIGERREIVFSWFYETREARDEACSEVTEAAITAYRLWLEKERRLQRRGKYPVVAGSVQGGVIK